MQERFTTSTTYSFHTSFSFTGGCIRASEWLGNIKYLGMCFCFSCMRNNRGLWVRVGTAHKCGLQMRWARRTKEPQQAYLRNRTETCKVGHSTFDSPSETIKIQPHCVRAPETTPVRRSKVTN